MTVDGVNRKVHNNVYICMYIWCVVALGAADPQQSTCAAKVQACLVPAEQAPVNLCVCACVRACVCVCVSVCVRVCLYACAIGVYAFISMFRNMCKA
jgi:hypothetical protein